MVEKVSAPFTVVLAVTGRCNLSCMHCGVSANTNLSNELTKDELFAFIDELEDVKVFNIGIFGGEPFCRRDIFEILDYIHSKPFAILMSSNATLITKQMAHRLNEYPKLKRIVISLDGDTQAIVDRFRGKGAFLKTIRGIRNILSKTQLKVRLKVTITKLNFDRLRNIVVLGKELGVDHIVCLPLFFRGNAMRNLNELKLSIEENKRVFERLQEVSREFGSFVSSHYSLVEKLTNQAYNRCDNANDSKTIIVNKCIGATKRCYVSWDGWVTPCEVVSHLRAGNIRRQKFLDIWENSRVMRCFREPMRYSLNEFPKCVLCNYKRFCYQVGRCLYYYEGDLKIADMNCFLS